MHEGQRSSTDEAGPKASRRSTNYGATHSQESEQEMQELQWHTPVHGSSWSDEHWLTDVHVLRWRQLGFQLALSPEERDISLLSHMRYLENI